MNLMSLLLSWFPLLLTWQLWDFPITQCEANPQTESLYDVVISSGLSRSSDNALSAEWPELPKYPSSSSSSSVYVGPQKGLREADKIVSLPGQPLGVEFDQYSGYVTVEPTAGRSLFYYFAESPRNSSAKPLVLWLAGGPGCSSFGFGSFLQLGPFKVHSDGKTLYMNDYSWNKVANVLFLESPAGVGFSYSNTTSDYNTTGDKRSAEDAYTFLVNWFERFPQYKNRDLYLTGVSYGGRFVAQLAYTIVAHNQNPNQTFINLKDIAIGNPSLDRRLLLKGNLEYLWTHAMISDKTHAGINKYCDFDNANYSASCEAYISKGKTEVGPVLRDNIYSSACKQDALKPQSPVSGYDECSCNYVEAFVNRKNVQEALHAINTNWTICSKYIGRGKWKDSPDTVLPVLKQLIANKVNIWILSGDIDGIISVTTTRLAVNAMQLAEVTDWRPWLSNQEVGGYVEGYKGLTLVTIRGAGHEFASYQPERSLTVISAFLQNKLPPAV